MLTPTMLPASTFRGGGRRPDPSHRLASSSSSAHREDEQPNEAINQRQRARPPSVVSASLPPSGRGHWARDGSGSDSQAIQRSRSGWNQHAARGNKGWRGARGGRGGRHVGHESHRASSYHGRHPSTTREQTFDTSSPSWNKGQDHHQPASPTNFTRPVTYPTLGHYPYEPPDSTHRAPTTSPSLVPLRRSEVKNGTMLLPSSSEKSCTITTSTLQTQSYETNQSTHHTHFAPYPSSATQTQSKPNNGELAVPITRSIAPSTISRDATPPLKRRRLSHSPRPHIKAEEVEDPIIPTPSNQHSTSPQLPLTIKPELRSPSPPSRRLITQSCTLYPLPDNCRKMNPLPNPEYAKNRTALINKERGVLKRRGFKVTNVLFRDDGMVIEWTSPVPVWSDTLLPEPVIPPDKVAPQRRPFPLPVPNQVCRRSGSREEGTRARMSPLSSSNRVPLPSQRGERPDYDQTVDGLLTPFSPPPSVEPSQPQKAKGKGKTTEVLQRPFNPASRRPLPLPKPRPKAVASAEPPPEPLLRTPPGKTTTKDGSQGVPAGEDHFNVIEGDVDVESRNWSVEELAEVEPMAVDFLQRYIRAFDTDISTLRHAYAPYATFSLRTPSDATHRSSGLALSESKTRQGPAEIAQGLSLLSSYKFCPGGIARDLHVCYDVVSLSIAAGGGILLTVHGEVFDVSRGDADRGVAGEREGFVMLDQAFVLQRNPEWKGGGGGGEGWPLVAVSHQMVMREGDGLSEAARVGMYDGDFTWLE